MEQTETKVETLRDQYNKLTKVEQKMLREEVAEIGHWTEADLEREAKEYVGRWKTARQIMEEGKNPKGRPTAMSQRLQTQIRQMLLSGMTRTEIIEHLGISGSTWSNWMWKNLHGFRDLIVNAEAEIVVRQAKANVVELLSKELGEDGNETPENKRIRADMTKFALQALDEQFKKKDVLGGISGDKVQINVIQYTPEKKIAIDAVNQVLNDTVNGNNNTP